MDKKSVYIETSIVSYLTARPSNNLIAAAWQQMTLEWWEQRRERFELFTSDATIEEAGKGDYGAAQARLEVLNALPLLPVNDGVRSLAKTFLREGALPSKAVGDAIHIAIAAVHEVDYLLTWNCRHIDNAENKRIVRHICGLHGYQCPEICTPQELMGV